MEKKKPNSFKITTRNPLHISIIMFLITRFKKEEECYYFLYVCTYP